MKVAQCESVISETRSDYEILQNRGSGEKGVYPSCHKQSLFLDPEAEDLSSDSQLQML